MYTHCRFALLHSTVVLFSTLSPCGSHSNSLWPASHGSTNALIWRRLWASMLYHCTTASQPRRSLTLLFKLSQYHAANLLKPKYSLLEEIQENSLSQGERMLTTSLNARTVVRNPPTKHWRRIMREQKRREKRKSIYRGLERNQRRDGYSCWHSLYDGNLVAQRSTIGVQGSGDMGEGKRSGLTLTSRRSLEREGGRALAGTGSNKILEKTRH